MVHIYTQNAAEWELGRNDLRKVGRKSALIHVKGDWIPRNDSILSTTRFKSVHWKRLAAGPLGYYLDDLGIGEERNATLQKFLGLLRRLLHATSDFDPDNTAESETRRRDLEEDTFEVVSLLEKVSMIHTHTVHHIVVMYTNRAQVHRAQPRCSRPRK